jgi:hypothetical protein
MSDATWSSRLAEAIASLADHDKQLSFPAECEKALVAALKQGVSEKEKSHLKDLLLPLKTWGVSPTPSFAEAFAQWELLHAFGPPSLPDIVLVAVLQIFPTYSGHDREWLSCALATRRLAVVNELLKLGLVSEYSLKKCAAGSPSEFTKSRLVEAIPPESAIWDSTRLFKQLSQDVARAAADEEAGRLIPGVLSCYAYSTNRRSDAQLLSLLSSESEYVCRRVLDELLRRPELCLRFVGFLKTCCFAVKASSSRKSAEHVVRMLVVRALDVIQAGSSPGAEIAGLSLATLEVAAHEAAIRRGMVRPAEMLLSGKQKAQLMACIAQHAAANSASGYATALVSGRDIATAFGSPSGVKTTAAASTVAAGPCAVTAAHEAGTRRVLADFARLAVEEQDPARRDNAIRNTLFNHGVREFGSVGDELAFDSGLHDTRDAGVFPGDSVKIVRPGQEIVAAGNRYILVKATVAASQAAVP